MIKLSTSGLKVLKALHIFTVAGWFGGGLAMNLLAYKTASMDQESSLLTAYQMIEIIDMQLVANCAVFTLVIGLIYSIFTHWGFIQQPWIVIKWIISVFVIGTGVAYSSNYLEQLTAMAGQFGLAALQNPEYIAIAQANLKLGLAQLVLLAIAIILSIIKPGRKGRV